MQVGELARKLDAAELAEAKPGEEGAIRDGRPLAADEGLRADARVHQAEDLRRVGPDRHPHADLPGAPGHRVGEHAVEPDGGKEQGEGSLLGGLARLLER